MLVQGQDIHISFCEQHAFLRGNGSPGLKQAIEMVAFGVDRGFTGIKIFGILIRFNAAPPEGDNLTCQIINGKDNPSPEPIIYPPGLGA